MTAYKVKSSLIFESHYGDIDFKGCEARIVNETESYYFVQFYYGLPFMISKPEFGKASVEIDKPTTLTGMEVHDVNLWLGDRQIKRFRTLLSPDDPEYHQVKKNALTWFKLSEGIHYDNITTELLNKVSKFNIENNSNKTAEMAKKQPGLYHVYVDRSGLPEEPVSFHWEFDDKPSLEEVEARIKQEDVGYQRDYCKVEITLVKPKTEMTAKKAEVIEEAEVIQDLITIEPSDDTLVFVKRIGDVLPVKFPEKFITPDYGEHSKADADEKKKKLDLAIKAIKGHDDVAGYEKVKELANVFQKGATRLDAATKEYVKPFDNVTKSFKQTSKTVQEYYREYEQIAREKYKEYTDWEEEQARKKEEERQARATARRKSLFDIGGVTDPTTGNWTFHYSGETVPDIAILDFDDIDWQAKFERIQAEHQDHLAKVEENRKIEQAAQSAKDAELEAAKTIIVKMRSKELKYEGWEFDEGLQSYTKNGHAIHVLGVRDYSDEQWDEAIEAANQPQEEKAVEAPEPAKETPKAQAPVWDEEETEEAPVEAVSVDPVASALGIEGEKFIKGMEPEPEDDSIVKTLMFTPESPYIDILLNKTFLRIYPVELDEEANADISKDRIKSIKEHGDLRLAIVSL